MSNFEYKIFRVLTTIAEAVCLFSILVSLYTVFKVLIETCVN